MIGSLTRCAHIARTDAPPIRGVLDLVPDGAGIPGRPDLRFRALADVMPGMRQVRQDTANAVGCNHPPGFRSPILRAPDLGVCARAAGSHRRLNVLAGPHPPGVGPHRIWHTLDWPGLVAATDATVGYRGRGTRIRTQSRFRPRAGRETCPVRSWCLSEPRPGFPYG